MLITSQRRLNFGLSDQPAMDRRFSTNRFKSSANPTKRASTWLKKHPMECLIWATEKTQEARHQESEEEDESETDEERTLYEDGTLQQSEKEPLQALSLDEALIEESAPATAEEQDSEVSTASQMPARGKTLCMPWKRGSDDYSRRAFVTGRRLTCFRQRGPRGAERRRPERSSTNGSNADSEIETCRPRTWNSSPRTPNNRCLVRSRVILSDMSRGKWKPENSHVAKLLGKHSRALGSWRQKESSRSTVTIPNKRRPFCPRQPEGLHANAI